MFFIQKDQVPVLCIVVPYVRRCVRTITHIVNNGISLNFSQEYISVILAIISIFFCIAAIICV